METFDFCPYRNVPEILPREGGASTMSLGGWQFSARPTTPYQRRFKVTLSGLRWYLESDTGFFDRVTNPKFNAHRLQLFYEEHETWKPFLFIHQHLGPRPIECRFASSLAVPKSQPDSGGLLSPLEVMLIHHNPGYNI